MASEKITNLVEEVKGLSVLELSELVKAIEEEFGVTAAAPVVVAGGAAAPAAEEKTEFDVVLADDVYTEGNYALTFNNDDCHICSADKNLNSIIKQVADISDIKVTEGNTVCTDAVDFYMTNPKKFFNRIPKNIKPIAAEMEAFALFYNAKLLNKKAACLMTVVDSQFINKQATPEEREQGLTKMIKIALEAGILL